MSEQAHVSSCNAGQSNDGIFKYARAGRATCKVDRITEVRERSLVLATGEEVAADLIVFAYGLKYQAEPECLKELGIGGSPLLPALASPSSAAPCCCSFLLLGCRAEHLWLCCHCRHTQSSPAVQTQQLLSTGFKDLHSFAFLGPSGRIGTAQDGIFAYVPAGPHKQFDMFLHSYQCYKRGLLQVLSDSESSCESTSASDTSCLRMPYHLYTRIVKGSACSHCANIYQEPNSIGLHRLALPLKVPIGVVHAGLSGGCHGAHAHPTDIL